MIELNHLDILGKRKLSNMPSHFAKTKLATDSPWSDDYQDIHNWVSSKLKGRYSIVKMPGISQDGKIKSLPFIGFEDHKELTYFMLACPHIRR